MPFAAGMAGATLSEMPHGLAEQGRRERVSVRDLIDALGDRALGALLVFLAAQSMLGRRFWLLLRLSSRSRSQADAALPARRIAPWLQRGERMRQPRFSGLTQPPLEYALGAVRRVLAIVLVRPIPPGNVLLAVAISLWVLAGLGVALLSAGVASGVIFAAVTATMPLMQHLPH